MEKSLDFVRKCMSCGSLAISVCVLAVAAATAADFNVSAGDTAGLIAAITDANSNGEADTINLEPGTYVVSAPLTEGGENGMPTISSDITIVGGASTEVENVIVRAPTAEDSFRIFDVDATGQLTLNNLWVSGGEAQGGGGVRNSGTLSLILSVVGGFTNGEGEVVIPGNSALEGGGILNLGTLNMNDSNVAENVAGQGGGISNYGLVTLTNNSAVSQNTAELSAGGMLNNGSVEMSNSAFSDNTVNQSGGGGGMLNRGTVSIANGAFDGNFVLAPNGTGGGLLNEGTADLTNTAFTENGAFRGGGLYNAPVGEFDLFRGAVQSNLSFEGAGIYNMGQVSLLLSIVSQNDATFFDGFGFGNGSGGGIFNDGGDVSLAFWTFVIGNAPDDCVGCN